MNILTYILNTRWSINDCKSDDCVKRLLSFMHSKHVKFATEESTGFDEVLHNTATALPFLSV